MLFVVGKEMGNLLFELCSLPARRCAYSGRRCRRHTPKSIRRSSSSANVWIMSTKAFES
jgi:hypothetical protein